MPGTGLMVRPLTEPVGSAILKINYSKSKLKTNFTSPAHLGYKALNSPPPIPLPQK
jgi:hypothetical protein